MKRLLLSVVALLMLLVGMATAAPAAWGDPVTPTCPKGWFLYNGTICLSLFTQQEPWDEARRQCEFSQPDSDLAIVDTADKKAYVHTMVHADPPFIKCGLFGLDAYWIGAHDRRYESQFEWLETQQRLDYTNWSFLEPNNQWGEDCVEMRYDDGKWNDEDCGKKQCFVCEAKATI